MDDLELARRRFGRLLQQHRVQADLSCNALARAAGVDPSYISRLERGDREPPRQHVALRICQALALDTPAADRLLVAGGYAPVTTWHPLLATVARVLTDPRIPPADRSEFEAIIELLAAKWIPKED